jgi:protein SCO1/2
MMRNKFSTWMFLALVIALPVTVFAVVNWYEINVQQLPVINATEYPVENFHLTNQQGEVRSPDAWKGKIVVANFFFTHCPVICPKMMRQLKRVEEVYINDPQLLINSFSVDPEHDSQSRLKTYATQMGINGAWDLLTGDKQQIYRLARKSFAVSATDGDGGPTDFIHSDKLILLDKQKRIRGYYNGTEQTEVDQLIKDIQRLRNE